MREAKIKYYTEKQAKMDAEVAALSGIPGAPPSAFDAAAATGAAAEADGTAADNDTGFGGGDGHGSGDASNTLRDQASPTPVGVSDALPEVERADVADTAGNGKPSSPVQRPETVEETDAPGEGSGGNAVAGIWDDGGELLTSKPPSLPPPVSLAKTAPITMASSARAASHRAGNAVADGDVTTNIWARADVLAATGLPPGKPASLLGPAPLKLLMPVLDKFSGVKPKANPAAPSPYSAARPRRQRKLPQRHSRTSSTVRRRKGVATRTGAATASPGRRHRRPSSQGHATAGGGRLPKRLPKLASAPQLPAAGTPGSRALHDTPSLPQRSSTALPALGSNGNGRVRAGGLRALRQAQAWAADGPGDTTPEAGFGSGRPPSPIQSPSTPAVDLSGPKLRQLLGLPKKPPWQDELDRQAKKDKPKVEWCVGVLRRCQLLCACFHGGVTCVGTCQA